MNSRKDDNRRPFRQLGPLFGAGMVFPVSIAIGYGMGYYLDRWLGTHFLYIVFLLFGIAAGFVSFFRTIIAAERDEAARDERSECKPDAKRKRDSAQPQDRAQPSSDDNDSSG